MKIRRTSRAVAALMGAGALTVTAALATSTTAQASSNDIVYHVGPQTFVHAKGLKAHALPTPSQCIATYGLACYAPLEIRRAYDVPDSWDGAGESIAIVDAYGSPTVQSDLDIFSATMGIPSTTVHVYCPDGCPKTKTAHKGQPLGWAGETSLDVQWAHAIAPAARINLVVASNNYGNALNNAVRYAVSHDLGDVLSMSYGAPESAIKGRADNTQLKQAHAAFADATAKGISLFASTGDDGASFGEPAPTANYPSSDPLVTGVGGTNLFTDDEGNYLDETVWGDQGAGCPFGCTFGPIGATGGAPSVVFPAPAYQQGVTGNSMRTTSDVSYNASVYTAVLVYEGFNPNPDDNGLYFVGGTSSGSPQWAAIAALADQQNGGNRLGALNPKLYPLAGTSAFHDVTTGNNAWDGPGFDGAVGYDYPTGIGSPDVANLVAALTH